MYDNAPDIKTSALNRIKNMFFPFFLKIKTAEIKKDATYKSA